MQYRIIADNVTASEVDEPRSRRSGRDEDLADRMCRLGIISGGLGDRYDDFVRRSTRPRRDEDFRVTGIRVLDPLYPHGSSVWGASPRPNRLLTPKQLAKQFVLRDRARVNLGVGPGYLLVLPVS